MDVFKNYVTKQLPAYLQSLPIPSNLEGFAELSQDEIIAIVPFFLLLSSMIVMIVIHLLPEDKKRQRLNTTHRLSEPKVVDKVSTPKGEKDVYCRCWQSKTVC